MSLKAFHVFFVILSVLCALGFGAWAVGDFLRTGNGGVLALGVLGFVVPLLVAIAFIARSWAKRARALAGKESAASDQTPSTPGFGVATRQPHGVLGG